MCLHPCVLAYSVNRVRFSDRRALCKAIRARVVGELCATHLHTIDLHITLLKRSQEHPPRLTKDARVLSKLSALERGEQELVGWRDVVA